jgi:hypothetical protein
MSKTVKWTLWLMIVLGCFSKVYWDYWRSKVQQTQVPKIADSLCRQTYLRLFDKKVVKILVSFGYKDARPARFVGDRYERNALIATLISPCEGDRRDCGFQRTSGDANLLTKSILGLDEQIHQVHLRVVDSSAGPDDDENRQDPFQAWKTEEAERLFKEGLESADVVFYNGHSRDGGGPDFALPVLLKNQHVNYRWYQQRKLGVKIMQKALMADSDLRPQLVGLFSCVSERLVPQVSSLNEIGWITNRKLVYYAEALETMRDALSAVLSMKCKKDFESILAEEKSKGARSSISTATLTQGFWKIYKQKNTKKN